MKQVLVVGGRSFDRRDQERKQEQLAFMSDALGKTVRCYIAFMDDLRYSLEPGKFQVYDTRNNIDLQEIDVVFIRGMEQAPVSAAYYLSRYCAWSNTPCVSDYSIYAPADKVAQAVLFLEHGVSFLQTLYISDSVRLITEAEAMFGYPYILKDAMGSHGDHNYLIHARQEAEKAIAADKTVDFLAQAFCPNDRDYRLLIVGKEYLLFERRGGAATHLNNTSKGAQATKATNVLPASIISQSQELAEGLGLMLAGVDIMPHKETGELYFLEVNLQPQLLTGAFLSDKKQLIGKLFDSL